MASDPPPTRRLDGRTIGIAVCIAVLAALVAGLVASAVLDSGSSKPGAATTANANVNLTPAKAADGSLPSGPIPQLKPGHPTFTFADFAGRPVIVNFFSSTCAPCIKEMPGIEQLHQKLGSQVTIVGINMEDQEADATKLVRTTGVTYLIGFDPAGDLLRDLKGSGMPTTVIADAHGKVVASHTGALTPAELEQLLRDHHLLPA